MVTSFTPSLKSLIKPLKRENLFKSISFIDIKSQVMPSYYKSSFYDRTFNRSKVIQEVFEKYTNIKKLHHIILDSEINIFSWLGYLSGYFIVSFPNNNITLIEDGERSYIARLGLGKILKRKYLYRSYIGEGVDEAVNCIQVQRPGELPSRIRDKAKKLNLKHLSNKLSENQIEKIFRIFGLPKFDLNKIKNGVLLITQPLSEDGFISEKEKLDLYKKIIDENIFGKPIFLKPHPREETNYNEVFQENINYIPRAFPLEIFNLQSSIKFQVGITIWSSSIKNLECVKEKIFLGVEYDSRLKPKKVLF
tara:strand:- start:4738 stop:5658 length:921 start_codon:yes stop_codon:yes gene_type:complete